jgi:hypothetical protein
VVVQCLDIIRRSANPILGDLTFRDNITDKAEAATRFRRFIERVRRKAKAEGREIEICGAWELQARGAWHPHYVCSHPLDVNWVREIAQACGFGPQFRLDYIKPRAGFRNISQEKAARYCAKYVTKDCGKAELRGKRLPLYFNTRRVCGNRFEWVGGLRRLFRLGCRQQFGAEGSVAWDDRDLRNGIPRLWAADRQAWMTPGERWRALVQVGLGSLPEGEQAALCESSQSVYGFACDAGLIDAPF